MWDSECSHGWGDLWASRWDIQLVGMKWEKGWAGELDGWWGVDLGSWWDSELDPEWDTE